jgi:hypothetical protein
MKGKPDDIAVNAVLRRCRMALLAFVTLSMTACTLLFGEPPPSDPLQRGNPFDDAISPQSLGDADGIVRYVSKNIERLLRGRRDVEAVHELLTAYGARCERTRRSTVCRYRRNRLAGMYGLPTMLHYQIDVTARAGRGRSLVLDICADGNGAACISTTLK